MEIGLLTLRYLPTHKNSCYDDPQFVLRMTLMKQKKQILSLAFITLFSTYNAYATDFGVSFAEILSSHEPTNMHGYRAAMTYEPSSLRKSTYSVYFDAGFTHLSVDSYPYHSLSVYSIAPYIRYYFLKRHKVSPYIEASVGFAYLTKTQLENRPQGIHFTFQDQLGIGLAYGAEQRFFTTISAIHYSNGSFSEHNSGITAPVLLTLGYRF